MLIAQISDCHIVEPGRLFVDRVDSAAGLRATVASINALELQPDVVLATGDLVNDGTAVQYDHFDALVAELRAPLVPLPGNHDDRGELRRRHPGLLPGGDDDTPIDHVLDAGAVRIVCLDTTIPDRHDGRLTRAQLAWLDATLAGAPDRPTLVAQHHPPLPSGMVWMDRHCSFDGGDGEAEVIGRHPHVVAVVSGHLHRSLHARFGGTIGVTCPSTACQMALGLVGEYIRYTSEPTAFALHHWRDGGALTSHTVPVGHFDTWSPTWTG